MMDLKKKTKGIFLWIVWWIRYGFDSLLMNCKWVLRYNLRIWFVEKKNEWGAHTHMCDVLMNSFDLIQSNPLIPDLEFDRVDTWSGLKIYCNINRIQEIQKRKNKYLKKKPCYWQFFFTYQTPINQLCSRKRRKEEIQFNEERTQVKALGNHI